MSIFFLLVPCSHIQNHGFNTISLFHEKRSNLLLYILLKLEITLETGLKPCTFTGSMTYRPQSIYTIENVSGIPVVYQWNIGGITSGISVAKFGGITSGIYKWYGTGPGSNSRPLDLQTDSHLLPDTLPTALRGPVGITSGISVVLPVEYQWYTSEILVVYQGKSAVKFGGIAAVIHSYNKGNPWHTSEYRWYTNRNLQ